tara:strand:+ start:532 stop:831 length:300 start_codon:yes stop_codon:yes gene_type:complete
VSTLLEKTAAYSALDKITLNRRMEDLIFLLRRLNNSLDKIKGYRDPEKLEREIRKQERSLTSFSHDTLLLNMIAQGRFGDSMFSKKAKTYLYNLERRIK